MIAILKALVPQTLAVFVSNRRYEPQGGLWWRKEKHRNVNDIRHRASAAHKYKLIKIDN